MLYTNYSTEESVKTSAKTLHTAITVALAPYANVHYTELPLRVPSLQQCQSIISNALGFASHNGFISAISNGEKPQLDMERLEQSIQDYLLRCNGLDDITSIISLSEIVAGNYLKIVTKEILQILSLFNAFPFLQKCHLPKKFVVHECEWVYQYSEHSRYPQYTNRFIYDWFVSLIIESFPQLDSTALSNDRGLINIPLRTFLKIEEHWDINKSRSIARDICDVINILKIAEVQEGMIDVEDFSKSTITWIVPISHFNAYKNIHRLQDYYAETDGYLNSLLRVYPQNFINTSSIKKIKGASRVWYHLYRKFFYRLIKLHAELPAVVVRVCENADDEDLGVCNLEDYMRITRNPNTDLPQYAVQDLDNQVDELVLPLIRKEKEIRDKIISIVQDKVHKQGGLSLLGITSAAAKTVQNLRMEYEMEYLKALETLKATKR